MRPLRPFATAEAAAASRGRRAWLALAASLALLALLGRLAPAAVIDWQPGLAGREPWRAWSSAGLHYSRLHLLANLAGLLGVALLGSAARLPLRSALAWGLAWPLASIGLLLRPDLAHAGGLSGVLHAGVAVAAVHLALARGGAERLIGIALAIGLAVKVLAETPWGPPLRTYPGIDIAVAPAMHASGLVSGALGAAALEALACWRRRRAGVRRRSPSPS